MKLQISVQLKPEILDPEAREIQSSLSRLGHKTIQKLTITKNYVLTFDENATSEAEARELAEQIAHEHLANPVAQSFQVAKVSHER